MTPIIPSLSPLFEFLLPRNISGTDFGTGYGGTVCGFHTRPGTELSHARRAKRVCVSVSAVIFTGKFILNNKRTFSSKKTCLVMSSRAS